MCSSKWSSPLVSGSTGSVKKESVAIPKDGWYALFFGRDDETASPAVTADDDTSLLSGCYNLNIATTKEYTCTVRTIKLPLDENGRLLDSLLLGKLIYLTEGSTLSVAAASTSSQEEEEEEPRLRADTSSLLLPKWRVIFYAEIDGNEKKKKLGELSQRKKSIVCGTCTRCFPSVRAVTLHARAMHCSHKRSDKSNNSEDAAMWTRPLPVIYQDACMAVVVKPQGMPVQGATPCLLKSDLLLPLAASKAEQCTDDDDDDKVLAKPRPVHRLDAGTGGLLVLAKTRRAESNLRKAFEERQCHKRYRAIVVGKLCMDDDDNSPDHGVINATMGGKEAQTLYRPVRHVRSVQHEWLTDVELWPLTGRRHQLRKHMKLIGHSIVGDQRYSGKTIVPDIIITPTRSRLCLWAMEISLPHPSTGEQRTFSMEEPEWLSYVLQREEEELRQTQEKNVQ